NGNDNHSTSPHAGNKKKIMPKTSILACVRLEKRCDNTSTRTCSFFRNVYPAASKKIAPNKYHWSSSHALELTLKTLRTPALVALTSTTTNVSHVTARPTRKFSASMYRDNCNRGFMRDVFQVSAPIAGQEPV